MNAVIIANGELQDDARLREWWQRADLRIAANGGARNARIFDLAPQVVIGDFDSLDDVTRAWLEKYNVEFIQHPSAKDQTDLELALDLALARGAQELFVLGALGGRIDQFLANVLLLTRELNVVSAGAGSEMWTATQRATVEGNGGDTVSLIPLDERVEGIVTENLLYPLRDETLTRGSTRGISNVMLESRANVQWKKGLLLIVHLFQSAI